MRQGYRGQPLMKSDIEVAQANTKSAAQAARYLNLAYNTYKKWAKRYGIWKTNPQAIGISSSNRMGRFKKQEDALKAVLNGKKSNYSLYRFTSLLIKYGFLREECYKCGYNEQRVTDRKVPLILVFLDGNKLNLKIENMEMVCFNCYHNQIGELNGHMIKYSYYKDTSQ